MLLLLREAINHPIEEISTAGRPQVDLREMFNDVYNTASVRHIRFIQMVEVNVSINIPDKSYPYPRYY